MLEWHTEKETWENRRRNPHQLLPIGPSTPLWSLSNSMVCLMQTTHGNATPPKMRLRTSREARQVVHIHPSSVKELRLGRGWLAGHEIRGCPPSQTEKHAFATSGKMDHSHESLSCITVCTVKLNQHGIVPETTCHIWMFMKVMLAPNHFKKIVELYIMKDLDLLQSKSKTNIVYISILYLFHLFLLAFSQNI